MTARVASSDSNRSRQPLVKNRLVLPSSLIVLTLASHWVGLFPAVMSFDSLDQWHQAVTGRIVDWHPAAHTLALGIFQRLFDSPAAASAVQAVLTAGLFLWSLRLSWQLYPSNRLQRWLMVVLVICTPVVGLYTVTLWKDVTFALVVAATCLLSIRIMQDSRERLAGWRVVQFATLFAVMGLTRKAGLVVIVLTVLAWMIWHEPARQGALVALGLALTTIVVVRMVVFPAFDVAPGDAQTAIIPFFFLSRVVAENGELTPASLELVSSLQSLDAIRANFDPYRVDYVTGLGFNWELAVDRLDDLIRAALVEGGRHPDIAISHLLDTGGLAWNPLPRSDRLYIGPTSIEWQAYPVDMGLRSETVPPLTDFLRDRIELTSEGFLKWLIWRPAHYLYLLVGVATYWLRSVRRVALIAAAPLATSLTVALVNPAPDVRYMYPVYLSLFVLIPFITRRAMARPPEGSEPARPTVDPIPLSESPMNNA